MYPVQKTNWWFMIWPSKFVSIVDGSYCQPFCSDLHVLRLGVNVVCQFQPFCSGLHVIRFGVFFFFTKDKYTDIFIFIYWMQCRTLDTNTINTWFPWILMNQNWRLSRTFLDQFVHYKNFQGKFQKAHIYVMANIIKFSFWFLAKGLKDIRQYQCRQWLQVFNKTIPEPLMTRPNAIYDITRPHWVNISIWLSMPHTRTQMHHH